MSLTSGLHCPRTPLRRFLDRELSAGPKPLRESFRAQHATDQVLLPPPGVGTEAGTVGTAIDQRLRLAFTTASPLDGATLIGMAQAGQWPGPAGPAMRSVAYELAARLAETVHRLELDNRSMPLDRPHEDEEDLARLLIAAAWYQVCARTSIGFAFTPLADAAREDPDTFCLERLLALPHPDMVADVAGQLYKTADGPLDDLRARTQPADCHGGPTFDGAEMTADADLIADGFLIDLKSTRHPRNSLSIRTAWQLLGYLLLDATDRYRIDTVGLYLTRSGVLASWPVEGFLDLLGTRRRDLTALRRALTELLNGCPADVVPTSQDEEDHIQRLLARLEPIIPAGHCRVCTQPLPEAVPSLRDYCSRWCVVRAKTLQKKGWLPPRPPAPLRPPRKAVQPPQKKTPRVRTAWL
ncbi:hypothetical protein ACH4LN_32020 [Streptomyces albus]|nr:hypothetical protein TPA0909_06790 [Streptomyces albus]